MKTFETGKTYMMRSICDHECIWKYKVIKRTKATITLQNVNYSKEITTHRISKGASEFYGAETIYPLGKYSMCPSLRADKVA